MGFAWFIIWCALTAVGLTLLARLLLPLVRVKLHLMYTITAPSAAYVLPQSVHMRVRKRASSRNICSTHLCAIVTLTEADVLRIAAIIALQSSGSPCA
jgi:hypothetical protein